MAAAVKPIATPMGTRCSEAGMTDATVAASGEAGWRSRLAKVAAESMNKPRQNASIAYSGQ